MEIAEYLSIGSIVITLVIGIVSWFVSAYLTKKTLEKKKLNYEIKLFPVISKYFLNKSSELKIYFQDELLPEPTLLAVDIINTGNVAIENPPIEIEAVGATYVIPGYIEDIPAGYEELWQLERTDTESCSILLQHINPGQVVKARFFLDELPTDFPVFKCPMKNVEVREVNTEMKQVFLKSLTTSLEQTSVGSVINGIYKLSNKK